MINNYVRYRNWWIKHKELSPSDLKWGATLEGEFKNHINSMTLYELMETLEGWGEEDNDEYAAGSETEKLMLEMFDD